MKSFEEVRQHVTASPRQKVIAVAAAEDQDVLEALKAAREMKLADAILVGNKEMIIEAAQKVGYDLVNGQIIPEADPFQAARKAVDCVRRGQANILMKGQLSTALFLKAILDKDCGLRTGAILSHVAVFEANSLDRLLLVTDCAMNISPGLQEKIQILRNAAVVTRALGIKEPKVAAVAAVETVNPDMPATMEAAILAKMCDRGQIKDMVIDGPLALDNAVSLESARHKGIKSPVAGQADVILVPNIEAGNIMYKTLVYLAAAQNAGVIMGAAAPVVLTSRSDSSQTKLNSIALSLLISA